jgi:hypothetical protein
VSLPLRLPGGQAIGQPRQDPARCRVQVRHRTHLDVASAFFGRLEYRFGDAMRIDHGVRKFRFLLQVVPRVLGIRRIDRRRPYQHDGDGLPIHVFDLYPQRIGESLHGMFGSRIHALQRHDRLGYFTADVDEDAAGRDQAR